MEVNALSKILCRLLSLLRRLAVVLLSILPVGPNRRLSLVAIRDIQLSFLILCCGLSSRIVAVNGGMTSVHTWIPRRRRPEKPALLLVHGFGGNSKWQFHRQIGPLSRFFDLYIPDLVFFGRSTSTSGERSVGFQARCVAEAMRELGVEKYSVAGVSYGGYVAFRLAASAAEVDKLVILTSGICTTAEERGETAARETRAVSEILLPQRAEDLMLLMRRSMYRPPNWVPAWLLRDFVEMMYMDHRKERLELLRELLSNGVDLHPLPLLNQETLIIWGDKDTVFPLYLAHRLLRHLGQKARLEVITEVGHALQLEKSNLVNHFIIGFIINS
ncbi:hypothetical protein AXF42_Ash015049 [Apostasia shenzhenica]|uniref:AB hydrolase-1 domain-containing protein n=1 Tax=Apostasia shenzhenica TaxID=1088818 RepID=A0A2I0B301_9ASPA|nr:hypothetical protein AXF42_Ash015049 [Apostasia shenzhenica]